MKRVFMTSSHTLYKTQTWFKTHHNLPSKRLKNFQGLYHAPFFSIPLMDTKSKVSVMYQAKVNVVSTELIFKNKLA